MITFEQLGLGLVVLLAIVLLVYAIKARKLRGFWNDQDGLTISEFLAITFTAGYFFVSWRMVQKMQVSALTDQDVDFFSVLSWCMVAILLDRTAGKVMDKLPIRQRKTGVTNNDTTGNP